MEIQKYDLAQRKEEEETPTVTAPWSQTTLCVKFHQNPSYP